MGHRCFNSLIAFSLRRKTTTLLQFKRFALTANSFTFFRHRSLTSPSSPPPPPSPPILALPFFPTFFHRCNVCQKIMARDRGEWMGKAFKCVVKSCLLKPKFCTKIYVKFGRTARIFTCLRVTGAGRRRGVGTMVILPIGRPWNGLAWVVAFCYWHLRIWLSVDRSGEFSTFRNSQH